MFLNTFRNQKPSLALIAQVGPNSDLFFDEKKYMVCRLVDVRCNLSFSIYFVFQVA